MLTILYSLSNYNYIIINMKILLKKLHAVYIFTWRIYNEEAASLRYTG